MKLNMFASCAPGLESLLAEEIRQLVDPWSDIANASDIQIQAGGVQFTGDRVVLAHALLGLGLASRILVRIAMFPVYELAALEKHMHRLPWSGWLLRDVPRSIRVTAKKSKLYHTGAVAQRIMRGIQHRLSDTPVDVGPDDTERSASLVARLEHDQCTISLDASGWPLHRRGYRRNPYRAALREDLARALVKVSAWDRQVPLLDPMCGSGTILTEAWLLASGRSPGMKRKFGIEHTAIGDQALQTARVQRSRQVKTPAITLIGSDQDAGAIQAAVANAESIQCPVSFSRQPVRDFQLNSGAHWIVTNPPWGGRVIKSENFKAGTRFRSSSYKLDSVYTQLGDLRRRCGSGSALTLLTSRRVLAYRTGVPMKSAFLTDAGGIKVNAFVEEPNALPTTIDES